MSKMSNINLELQEQAEWLGFSTTQEALDNGYHVVEDLIKGEFTLEKLSIDEQYEQAHEAWLKEKEEIVRELELVKDYMISMAGKVPYQAKYIERAITFIGRVSHE